MTDIKIGKIIPSLFHLLLAADFLTRFADFRNDLPVLFSDFSDEINFQTQNNYYLRVIYKKICFQVFVKLMVGLIPLQS